MSEQIRIKYLIKTYGIEGAKKKCVEYCHTYFEYAVFKLHRSKKDGGPLMSIYYPEMRRSIDEFLEFICGN